ncbi:hypothetical protein M404DRAFT_673684 [Pisolithus tinctorius Marx 270]|uniref:Uncharacterized protein n=1 Tax=Pisolithus tinctorius Marx 270 TaxID=870435 RepID=A0A0C3PEU2_PISTI|nr:hypothetical protein M404DRAFT_673684 [Pisolithus tinctorius Marx 270]
MYLTPGGSSGLRVPRIHVTSGIESRKARWRFINGNRSQTSGALYRIIGIRRLQKSKYSNNKTGKALLHKETSHTAFRILHMLSTDQHRPAHSDALLIGYQLPYHVAFRADQLEI